jgi:4-amino-4-deoxy-L-arabinose transferase-like glycosyltransferase
MRWLPLLAVAVLATGLRFFRIDAQSLWYDEGISAFQLTRSFPEILHAAALDTHPPLYYWTLKAWSDVFGGSELGLRSLSAVWGVATVVLTWLLGRRLFGPIVAGIAGLLLAVAPLAVYYSQEVRMYSQVTAFAMLAAYAYARRSNWLYALSGIATLYSQYLGIAVLAAVNLHALVWWRTRSRHEWLEWLGANAVVALAFLPWLPTFVDQQSHSLNTSARTGEGLVVSTLRAYGGGLASGSDLLLGAGIVLVVLAVIGLALSTERNAASLALLLWLVPLGLVLGLGLRNGLFELRYLVLGLPGMLLLTGLGITRLARHPALAAALAGLMVVPAVGALAIQYYSPTLARDDYRGVVSAIVQKAQPSDAIVLSAPNQIEVFTYYYRGDLALFPLPAQRPIDRDDTVRRLDAIRGEHERVWLVNWAMNEADPPGVIQDWLAQNGFTTSHQWFGSVQLALIGFSTSAPTERLDLALDNGATLEGYRLSSRTLEAGDTLALTLLWRASGPTPVPWKVFTHLLDPRSQVVAQRDAEPADNTRPTTTWAAGELIEDNYGILVPPGLPAGAYTLEIGMYSGEQRAQFAGRGNHLVLGTVDVMP